MERKNRPVLGCCFVLERQKRFSIETSERIYIENTQLKGQRLYHDPLVRRTNVVGPSHTSIFSAIEEIHRARQRVDFLNDQINHEIDCLKGVANNFQSRKSRPKKMEMASKKLMTWGESLMANRGKGSPLAPNRRHHSGRGRRSNSRPRLEQAPRPVLRELYRRNPPPKDRPPTRLPPEKRPPTRLSPENHPPTRLPPENRTPTRLPPKNRPPTILPPEKPPPTRLPPENRPPTRLPPEKRPPTRLPHENRTPTRLPPEKHPPNRLPPKGLPPKQRSPEELATRKPQLTNSTQKELNPGKPPPKELPPKEVSTQKPALKELVTRNPLPKKEPMQKKELTPEEPTLGESPPQRLSGGCCRCYCGCNSSYCTGYQNNYCVMNRSCHWAGAELGCYPSCRPIQGMQHGISYCVSPRRQVTDLNTEEICQYRNSTPKEMRSQQFSSKQTVSSSLARSKSRENRSPVRCGRTPENENNRRKNRSPARRGRSPENENTRRKINEKVNTTYKMRGQEKLLKVESRDKIMAARGKLQRDQSRERLRRDTRDRPRVRAQEPEVTEFVSAKVARNNIVPLQALNKEHVSGVNERMYQDYLNLYYQENSKEGKTLKTTSTFTRLGVKKDKIYTEDVRPKTRKGKPEKPLTHADKIRDDALFKTNLKEEERVTRSKDIRRETEVVRPHISDSGRNYQECTKEESTKSSPQSDPSLFSYETCRRYKSRDDNRTDCPGTRKTDPIADYMTIPHFTSPIDLHPTESRVGSSLLKSTRCQDKDRQVVRQERMEYTKERVVVHEVPKSVNRERSPSTRKSKSPIMESASYTSMSGQPQRSRDPSPKGQIRKENPSPTLDLDSKHQRSRDPSSKSQVDNQLRKEDPLPNLSLAREYQRSRDPSPKRQVEVRKVPKSVNQERSPSPRKSKSLIMESTNYTSMSGQHQRSRDASSMSPVDTQIRKENPIPSYDKSTQVIQDLYRPQRNVGPESFGAGPSRNQASALASDVITHSSCETIVINPHYPTKDSQGPEKNRDTLPDDGSDEELEVVQIDMKPHDMELLEAQAEKDYKADYRELLENESPHGILRQPTFNEVTDSQIQETNDFQTWEGEGEGEGWACKEELQEALPRKPETTYTVRNDSPLAECQSKYKILEDDEYTSKLRNVDQEDSKYARSEDTADYEYPTDDISEYDGYESAQIYDPYKDYNLQLNRSFSPQEYVEDRMPIVETVCEKRTRTVTFEDEQGDLEEQERVEEHCRSRIDWERALKYRLTDQASDQHFTDDNNTARTSSSADRTCIESSCGEEDADDSCLEKVPQTDQGMPPFEACPCMFETYRYLSDLCRKSTFY